MHKAATVKALYCDMIVAAAGEDLAKIGDKYGVAQGTMYIFRRRFLALADMIPELIGRDDRRDAKETEEQSGQEAQEEPEAETWKKPWLEKQRQSEVVDAERVNEAKLRGRQRDGYYSLPVVAQMLGKSVKEVRRLMQDYAIKPDCILAKRPGRNIPGYSEASIEKIRDSESKDVDSVELREILDLKPHEYQRFLNYAVLLMNNKLYAVRFQALNEVLQSHKSRHSYRFDRRLIPDIQTLKAEFIKERDGRRRENRMKKRELKALGERRSVASPSVQVDDMKAGDAR